MNFGLIGHGAWPLVGGLERPVYDCARWLAGTRFEVRVLSLVVEGSALPRYQVLSASGNARVEVFRAPALRPCLPGDPLSEPEVPAGAWGALVAEWSEILADTDVICTLGAAATLAGGQLRQRLGRPLVAVLPDFPMVADERFERVIRCGADLFVTGSRYMAERAQRLFGLQPLTIYCGVDTEFFRPTHKPLDYPFLRELPGPLVTAPVPLDPDKDIGLLIDAFAQVVSRRPDTTLLVTGGVGLYDSPLADPYYEQLCDKVRALGLGHSVFFARGAVMGADMPALYTRSDLCVMTSRREAFGLALAESLACQTPVVATYTEGLQEVFEDGTCGLYARKRDPEEIASCILALLRDEGLRQRLGRCGRRHVERRFAWSRQGERFIAACASLCYRRRAA